MRPTPTVRLTPARVIGAAVVGVVLVGAFFAAREAFRGGGASEAITTVIVPLALVVLAGLALKRLRRPGAQGPSGSRGAAAIFLAIVAWASGLVALLGTMFALVGAVWGIGLPCMGGGCDPGGSDPTGIGGLVVAAILAVVTVGCFWLGFWAYRRRRPRVRDGRV